MWADSPTVSMPIPYKLLVHRFGRQFLKVFFFLPQMVRVSVMQEKRVSSKSTPTDLVTEADQHVEQMIISTLREKFPSHRYYITRQLWCNTQV